MEKDSKENMKLFYRTLKSIRKEKTEVNEYIKSKKGEILTENKEIMDRWKEHFEELLNASEEHTPEEPTQKQKESDKELVVEEKITIKELQEVIKNLKNGKAPGEDKITTEMIKKMGTEGTEVLLKIYNRVWQEEQIPKDWQTALIVPIYKKGDKKDCNNYRGITLLCTAMKIFEQITAKKK